MPLNKNEAIAKVLAHIKKTAEEKAKEPGAKQPSEPMETLGNNIASNPSKGLNSAEEIALLQLGLEAGVFELEDLDEECRNLIGKA